MISAMRVLFLSATLFLLASAGLGTPRADNTSDLFLEGKAAYEAGDFARALELWQPMADAGDPHAEFAVGKMYLDGQGIEENAEKAIRFIYSAAQKGYAPAVYKLARADVWYLAFPLEDFVNSVFDKTRNDPDHRGKSEGELKAEIREFASGRRAFAAGWLILAAEEGDPKAISEKDRVFSRLTDAEKEAAESLADSRRNGIDD